MKYIKVKNNKMSETQIVSRGRNAFKKVKKTDEVTQKVKPENTQSEMVPTGIDIGFVTIKGEKSTTDYVVKSRSFRIFINDNRIFCTFSNKKGSGSFYFDPKYLSINKNLNNKIITILTLKDIVDMIFSERVDSALSRLLFSMILCNKRTTDNKIKVCFNKMFYEYILKSTNNGFIFTKFRHFLNFIESTYNQLCNSYYTLTSEKSKNTNESDNEYEYDYEEVQA